MKRIGYLFIGLLLFFTVGSANATLMDYTFYTADNEKIGTLTIDDANLNIGTFIWYSNTIVEDLYFEWDGNTATYADLVPGDQIILGFDGTNSWIADGAGYLSGGPGSDNAVWIYGTDGLSGLGGNHWDNGYWIVTENTNTPVPVPATILLFGVGLLGFAGAHRKR